MIRPTCHPNREHDALGMCRACYARSLRKHGRRPPAEVPCAVCGRPFRAVIPSRAKFCSRTCSKFHRAQRQNSSRGSARDHYFVSYEYREAAVLVRRLRANGFRRVPPMTNRYAMQMQGEPYYSAWRRSTAEGHYLYVVRWWAFRADEDEVEIAA